MIQFMSILIGLDEERPKGSLISSVPLVEKRGPGSPVQMGEEKDRDEINLKDTTESMAALL